MHSTRGRAHLLFEMLQGDPMKEGWKSEPVREALDLCLACKGCRTECPMNVDMATYKAEFLSHYYEGRLRPRHAYAMGWIYWWARLASLAPGLVEPRSRTRRSSARCFQLLGGISTRRTMPSFAPETFKAWFRRRAPRNVGGPRVLLWPDTFNNHFHPQTAKAAVEVLEAAGFQVVVPEAVALLRPAALRLRHARDGQAAAPPDPRRAPARRSRRARRSSGWSRAAWPSSATR